MAGCDGFDKMSTSQSRDNWPSRWSRAPSIRDNGRCDRRRFLQIFIEQAMRFPMHLRASVIWRWLATDAPKIDFSGHRDSLHIDRRCRPSLWSCARHASTPLYIADFTVL